MESLLVMTNQLQQENEARIVSKKDRVGRWTQSEAYLFETLLER